MLGVAKKLRQEREREKELQAQKGDQRTAIQHIDQRVARMEAKLKDSRQQVDKYSEGRMIWSNHVFLYISVSLLINGAVKK